MDAIGVDATDNYVEDGFPGAGDNYSMTVSSVASGQYDIYVAFLHSTNNDTGLNARLGASGAFTNLETITPTATLAETTATSAVYDIEFIKIGTTAGGVTSYSVEFDDIGGGAGRGVVMGIGHAPVPEPSSTALLGLGGLALILRRRK